MVLNIINEKEENIFRFILVALGIFVLLNSLQISNSFTQDCADADVTKLNDTLLVMSTLIVVLPISFFTCDMVCKTQQFAIAKYTGLLSIILSIIMSIIILSLNVVMKNKLTNKQVNCSKTVSVIQNNIIVSSILIALTFSYFGYKIYKNVKKIK